MLREMGSDGGGDGSGGWGLRGRRARLFGLQVACPNSASPPRRWSRISLGDTCWPIGPLDGERCVQAEEDEG